MEKITSPVYASTPSKAILSKSISMFSPLHALQSKLDDKWTTYSSHSTLCVGMCLLSKFFSLIFHAFGVIYAWENVSIERSIEWGVEHFNWKDILTLNVEAIFYLSDSYLMSIEDFKFDFDFNKSLN